MKDRYAQTAVPSRDEMATDTEIRPTICSICNPGSHCGVDAYVSNGRMIIALPFQMNNPAGSQKMDHKSLSAPIQNYDYILALIFFLTKTLSVEWIRSLISFFDRIYRIDWIFFACRERRFGRMTDRRWKIAPLG